MKKLSRRDNWIISGEQVFKTLIALTEEEHQRGLMFKPWPPPIMSFPYKKAAIRKFWMKNTPSPLDIIFCSENKVLDICEGKPYDTTMVGPNQPADLVVEMPQGFSEKYGISAGMPMHLKYSLDTLQKIIK